MMGTALDIRVEGLPPEHTTQAMHEAISLMQTLADAMSRYRPDSLVSHINRAAGQSPVRITPELMLVLQQAQTVAKRTGGAFDVTVGALDGWSFLDPAHRIPTQTEVAQQRLKVGYHRLHLDPQACTASLSEKGMRLDLGGVAKLYILEQGLNLLRTRGAARALINGGGDVLAFGGLPQSPWRIGIRDPLRPHRLAGVVALEEGVIASSGDYERYFDVQQHRYHHILNPKTGYPTEGLHGVTLIARHAAQVNGWGAAIMVMGAQAGQRWLQQVQGVQGYMADNQGQVWQSPDWRWLRT